MGVLAFIGLITFAAIFGWIIGMGLSMLAMRLNII